jgi:diguanylate cyclase (GGDEF)-like protein
MFTTLSYSLVTLGNFILAGALLKVRRLMDQLPQGPLRRKWLVQLALIVFFIMGYVAYLAAFCGRLSHFSDLLVPAVFFFGACFVWLTSSLSLQTAVDVKRITLLEHENVVDPLTGVYNRRYMDQRLKEECARARRYSIPISVLLLDIDHFKRVNDTYGHQNGDLVLSQLSKLVSQSIRDSDIVARYGGEEFLVIAPNTTAVNAVTLAARLLQRIESYEFVLCDEPGARQAIHATVSIGISDFVPAEDDGEKLIGRADAGLYQAKNEGRNRLVVKSISAQVDCLGCT